MTIIIVRSMLSHSVFPVVNPTASIDPRTESTSKRTTQTGSTWMWSGNTVSMTSTASIASAGGQRDSSRRVWSVLFMEPSLQKLTEETEIAKNSLLSPFQPEADPSQPTNWLIRPLADFGGAFCSVPSPLDTFLSSLSSEQQLQPETEDGRCAYALFVDARQQSQGSLADSDCVSLSSSD